MTRRRWLIWLIAGAALTLLLGRGLAHVYADYLWFAALGAADVWRAKYSALLALRTICGLVATLFVFANLYAVRQSVVSLVLPRRIGNLDIGEEVPKRQLTWTAAALSLLLGVALSWSRTDWSGFLLARAGEPFGETDPYFAADLGFFVYRLPLEQSLFAWTMTVILIIIGLVIALYALTPSLRWERGGMYVSGYVRRHLAMLAGALLLVLAWHYRIQMYEVLGHGSAPDGAFTHVDHRISIPASLLLALVTLGAGLTVLWAGWTGQMRLAFAALTGVIVAVIGARQLAPFVARRAFADGDPAVRERPYEATRAGYTRRAFAVDRVRPADSTVLFASVAEAALQVPVWDDRALAGATDRSRAGSAVGWSVSDSGIVAMVPTLLGGGSFATYLASGAEENGAPLRAPVIADPDGRSSMPPVLVIADSNARAIVVPDSTGRIAAPSLGSSMSRLAHALAMQDFRVWLGALPSPAPKLISRRSVRERVAALAPGSFFAQGGTITPLWLADSLIWAVNVYATSATYPLSQRIIIGGSERGYFQHAATALVNASTGRTVFVSDSNPDPITATWMTRFPRLFVRPTSLPAGVRRQLPPARHGARAQAVAFGRFGSRAETDVARHLPFDEGPDSALADSPTPQFGFPRAGATGIILPLLDRTERLRGLVIALGGPGHPAMWLRARENAPVWSEALDRLRAADTIAASLLVRGHVRAIPLRDEIVLIQPRYDWRGGEQGGPRLLYVPALLGDTVRAAPTLLELAGRLPESTPSTMDFRSRVRQLYDQMRRASSRGDWAAYGRAFDALGALLRQNRR